VNPAHYAVVIGINRYPGIRDLQLAKHDAEDFRAWLLSADGGAVPEENVKVVMADQADEANFADPISSKPTLREVNAALIEVTKAVRQRVQAERREWDASRLYVYASGHGIAPEDGAAAVLMADADADPLVESYGNSIEISKYTQWYVGCGFFREVVVFADCCRDRRYTAPGTGPPMSRCPEPYGATNCAVGYATTYATSAYEPTDVQDLDQARGYFTRALLDGLNGGAATQTGEITSVSLADYIAASVTAQTEGKPFKQQPSMPVDAARPIVFRPPGPPPARHTRSVTLTFPPGYAGGVSLLSGQAFADTGHRWDAASGPWTIQLEEGSYVVRPDAPVDSGFKEGGMFRVIAKDTDVQL
jgi:uncharacterized caspase-like protein